MDVDFRLSSALYRNDRRTLTYRAGSFFWFSVCSSKLMPTSNSFRKTTTNKHYFFRFLVTRQSTHNFTWFCSEFPVTYWSESDASSNSVKRIAHLTRTSVVNCTRVHSGSAHPKRRNDNVPKLQHSAMTMGAGDSRSAALELELQWNQTEEVIKEWENLLRRSYPNWCIL